MKIKLLALGLFVLSFQEISAGHIKFVNASNGKHKLDGLWIDMASGSCNTIKLFGNWLEETNGCHFKNHFSLAIDGGPVREFYLDQLPGFRITRAQDVNVSLEDNRVVVTSQGDYYEKYAYDEEVPGLGLHVIKGAWQNQSPAGSFSLDGKPL